MPKVLSFAGLGVKQGKGSKLKLTKIVFGFGILVVFMGLFACSQNTERRVDRLFKAYRGEDRPGAAVMVIQDGSPILTKCYGMANLEENIPVTSSTNFRLASVTKQFTAMSIMILSERGQLDINSSLQDIFPDFPEYGKDITIRHILQHNSGLIDYESLIPDTAMVQVLDRDVLRMMMAQDSTYFEPGTAYQYSNSGYAVLAMIVEQVSGKSFAQFLDENIFQPLGMNHTLAFEEGISTVSNRAIGYFVEKDSIGFSDQSLTSAVLGDGGIYSSIDDLLLWDQALYTDQLVSSETLRQIFTPGLENYGFGWRIEAYKGHPRVYHAGSTCGFRTCIHRLPEDEFTVIILTNRRDPAVDDLAGKLIDMYLIRRKK